MKTIALVLKCSEEPYVFEGVDGTIVENGILSIVMSPDQTLNYPLANVFNWTISPYEELVENGFDLSEAIATAVKNIYFVDDDETGCPVCEAEDKELETTEKAGEDVVLAEYTPKDFQDAIAGAVAAADGKNVDGAPYTFEGQDKVEQPEQATLDDGEAEAEDLETTEEDEKDFDATAAAMQTLDDDGSPLVAPT